MTSTTSAQPASDGSALWRRYLSTGDFLQGQVAARPDAPTIVKVNIPRALMGRVASPRALELDGYLLDLAPEHADAKAMDRVGCLLEPHPAGMRALGADFHWGAVRCLFAIEPLQVDLFSLMADEQNQAYIEAYTDLAKARSAFADAQYAASAD
ncbi:MAG: hypothetical protein QF464_03815, partial [Myxococcota bacterium]|nr:hypothetical protein [Myxococcota bacterium]